MYMSTKLFIGGVLEFWKENGRHNLPWRKTHDPYAILVSEIMLQQTQVDRVVPYFEQWMRKFSTVQKLAAAPLADVLKEWSGLGYNRRGLALKRAAEKIARGIYPDTLFNNVVKTFPFIKIHAKWIDVSVVSSVIGALATRRTLLMPAFSKTAFPSNVEITKLPLTIVATLKFH